MMLANCTRNEQQITKHYAPLIGRLGQVAVGWIRVFWGAQPTSSFLAPRAASEQPKERLGLIKTGTERKLCKAAKI
jgi:hypothetical protein